MDSVCRRRAVDRGGSGERRLVSGLRVLRRVVAADVNRTVDHVAPSDDRPVLFTVGGEAERDPAAAVGMVDLSAACCVTGRRERHNSVRNDEEFRKAGSNDVVLLVVERLDL